MNFTTSLLLALLFFNLTVAFIGRFACFKYGNKHSAIAQFFFVLMTFCACVYILGADKNLGEFVAIVAASGWLARFLLSDSIIEFRRKKLATPPTQQ